MPASKTQTSFRPATKYWAACIGDSHFYNYGNGVAAAGSFNVAGAYVPGFAPFEVQQGLRHATWPPANRAAFAAAVASVVTPIKCRNFGSSGDGTAQMIARQSCLTQFEIPDIGIIYGGTNDAGKATTVNGSGATTTSIPVQSGKAADFPVGSYVIIGGQSRRVTANPADTLTITPALSGAPANTTAVTMDTQANITVLGTTLKTAGCTRIVVVGQHFTNFSSGGDTTTVQVPARQTLRGLQSAAATAIQALGGVSCIYVDTYAYMAAMITSATPFNGVTYTQGDFAWHILDSDTHLNANGEGVLGKAIAAAIKTASWPAQLT